MYLKGNRNMKYLLLGAAVVFGLAIASPRPSFAAGGGLDPDARATGNSDFAGQHRGARVTSRGGTLSARTRPRYNPPMHKRRYR
jgi:hypothetical protein